MRVFIALALVICILSISIVQGRRVRERTITASEKIGLGVLTGPEGIAFDPLDSNIAYTGISDGSIRKVNLSTKEVTFYAYTVPSLNATQRAVCGTSPIYETLCGRPLGLVFDKDNNLIVADAYKGLIRIPRSNPANIEVLVNSFDGVPFKMLNSIVILKDGRTAYFTDTTQIYTRAQFVNIVIVNKPDGRLFKFDLVTKQIQVVIDDLRFANGIALSEDEDFLVVNECSAARIRRLYLKGHRAGRNDIFVDNIGGYNDNIKRDSDGNFLVALFGERIDELDAVHESTKLQNIFLQYVPPTATIGMITPIGLVKKVDPRGRVIEVIADRTATLASYVSEADEHDGFLYLGSVILPYLTRVSLSSGLSH